MEKKEYLNEEQYQKNKKKVTTIALIVLVVGILIGGSLIAIGIIKQSKINSKYSEDSKISLSEQIEIEKQSLIQTKTELEEKIKPTEDEIKKLKRETFTGFDDAYYARQDKIEELEKSISSDKKTISVIEDVLDNSDFACSFDGGNNTTTSKYCSLTTQLSDISKDFNKDFDSFDSIPFYMFGAFVIIAACMISGSIYMFAKRREITAFTTQQVMPVAQEGIDKMAPTIGNAAKEIAKGIKEGISEDKE
ncbi:MAG: hypothetical protein ACI4U4_03815 [Bacilli bacterium]